MNNAKKLFRCGAFLAICFAAYVGTSFAQGSRKDDIVFNAQGRPMGGALVRVCTSTATGQPCTPLAPIYSDAALTQALANPLSADGLGNYTFYATPGRYEIEISGPGITTKQLPNVILPSDPTSPTFTTVTTTSGISAFSLSLTGDLTVSGSLSVAGTLSLGGAPIPSTGQDNQWAASQRFKGPIPYRDFTAYMPAGGCSVTDTSSGANTTGTIGASSTSLTLASAKDFKNGCGIAVIGAGAAPAIVTPPSVMTSPSLTSSANVVTVSVSGGHKLVVGSGNDFYQGVQVTGCVNSAYNGTYVIHTVPNTTAFTYVTSASGTSSTSGCTVTTFFGYAHGIAGSTSYVYKIAAIDANMGYSAASGALTITTGNAALSKYNYNHLMWATETGAYMYAIYSDKGLGGALTCVATAFTNGFSDMGFPFTCPAFMPTNPPSSAGADTLNTIIDAGGGTTTLTLHNATTTAVSGASVYHDESSFLTACVNDIKTDQNSNPGIGALGCFIPAGTWWFNGEMPTATVNPAPYVIKILVSGHLVLHTIPWFFNFGQYDVEGVGSGGGVGSFDYGAHTGIDIASTVPAVAVFPGTPGGDVNFNNFSMGTGAGLTQDGIWANGIAALRLSEDTFYVNYGPAIHLEQMLWTKLNNINIGGGFAGSMQHIFVTASQYASQTAGTTEITNLFTDVHGIGFSAPGGLVADSNHNGWTVSNWLQEDMDPTDWAFIQVDDGPNAPGAAGQHVALDNISLTNVLQSDVGSQYNNVFALLGTGSGSVNTVILSNVPTTNLAVCVNVTSACTSGGKLTIDNLSSFNGPTNLTYLGDSNGFVQNPSYGGNSSANVSLGPLVFQDEGNPSAWFMAMPSPSALTVASTSSGSLSAGTYCIGISGVDNTGASNETNLSNIACQTVGASSSIVLNWHEGIGDDMFFAYSSFNLYYCVVVSGTCDPNPNTATPAGSILHIDGVGTGHGPVAYTFTAAGTSGTVPNANSIAQLSWISWDEGRTPYSCFFCTASNSDRWPVGFGIVPTANAGINIFSKLGIRAGTQYQASETTAPSGVANVDLLYADSTAHRWKAIDNNGSATNVTLGTDMPLSGTTGSIGGSALTAGQCASGTVAVSNSTTGMTVNVSPNTYPGDGFIPWGYVSANGTVTVKVCAQAAGTPTSSTYNVRVIQ